MSHDARLADLVIPINTAVSNAISTRIGIENIIEMLIYAPSAVDGTITVEVSPVQNPSAGDWRAFQFVPGTDVTIAAGKAVRVAARCIAAIRLNSGASNQAAARTFPIIVQQDT